jgi:hypothetical protein
VTQINVTTLDSIHHKLIHEHVMTDDMAAEMATDMAIDMDVDVTDDIDNDNPDFHGPISSGSNILMDHFRPNNYFNSIHFLNSAIFKI